MSFYNWLGKTHSLVVWVEKAKKKNLWEWSAKYLGSLRMTPKIVDESTDKTKLVFFFPIILFLNAFGGVGASVVAVVDSGVDIAHVDIAPSVWHNPLDLGGNSYDEDGNGFLNDVHGWNFAQNNGVLIDIRYSKYLTPEVRRFLEIQSDMLNGNMAKEDYLWAKNQLRNKKFSRSLEIYSNFMHGTHVGALAIMGTQKARLLTVKVKMSSRAEIMKIKSLSSMAKEKMESFEKIIDYMDGHSVDVANFSLGMTYKSAKKIVANNVSFVSNRNIKKRTISLLEDLMKEGRGMVSKAPGILFVLAAGNDGADNDTFPTFPANINSDNTITVAATFRDRELAEFSNYGKKTVDIAAPGVDILSAAPDGHYLSLSGTSQSAPLVAKAASMIKDSNPLLSSKQVKEILMRTVTKKSFLKGKVASEGVLNGERAVYAAELSTVMDLDSAIEYSLEEIDDPFVPKSNGSPFIKELKDLLLPLPMFL